jgi:hypothetical protein
MRIENGLVVCARCRVISTSGERSCSFCGQPDPTDSAPTFHVKKTLFDPAPLVALGGGSAVGTAIALSAGIVWGTVAGVAALATLFIGVVSRRSGPRYLVLAPSAWGGLHGEYESLEGELASQQSTPQPGRMMTLVDDEGELLRKPGPLPLVLTCGNETIPISGPVFLRGHAPATRVSLPQARELFSLPRSLNLPGGLAICEHVVEKGDRVRVRGLLKKGSLDEPGYRAISHERRFEGSPGFPVIVERLPAQS